MSQVSPTQTFKLFGFWYIRVISLLLGKWHIAKVNYGLYLDSSDEDVPGPSTGANMQAITHLTVNNPASSDVRIRENI